MHTVQHGHYVSCWNMVLNTQCAVSPTLLAVASLGRLAIQQYNNNTSLTRKAFIILICDLHNSNRKLSYTVICEYTVKIVKFKMASLNPDARVKDLTSICFYYGIKTKKFHFLLYSADG